MSSETTIEETPSPVQQATRCGFVALIGVPNAGKSTLLNALVGAKVSIVSRKVQTTRTQIRGITLENKTQIIFIDTPGIFAPKRQLEKAMVSSAWAGAGDADLVGVLVDVTCWQDDEHKALFTRLSELKRPIFLILNKIDLLQRDQLLAITQKLNEVLPWQATFMISALTRSGLREMRAFLDDKLPFGPWLYPEDEISDAPLRFLAAEITREKMFERLHDELPYRLTVETESWETLKKGDARINQTIYVERESQRKIVLGEKGRTIKSISMAARREIEEAAETKVHLFLFVKVRDNWSRDPERYREMGLEFPKS